MLGANTGSVLFEIADKGYRLDFIEFIILLVVGFAIVYLAVRLITGIFKIPSKACQWKDNRSAKKVGKITQQGYADLIKGDYASAESKLIMHMDKSSTPLLNCLAAAHAAHEQGSAEKRDTYFSLAYQADPSAKTAIDISRAEMQYDAGDIKGASETIRNGLAIAPKNEALLRLSLDVNRDLENWDAVIYQLPKLKKYTSATEQELEFYSFEAATALLDNVKDVEGLDVAWGKLSRAQKAEADYKRVYATRLADLRKPYLCEKFIVKSLKKSWDSELVYLFGLLDNDAPRQYKKALSWLSSNKDDANLLLTLGRLALRTEDKDAAKKYFEQAIEAGANEEADRELAKLMEEAGDLQKALAYYRSGMDKLSYMEGLSSKEVDSALEDSDDIIIVDEKPVEKAETKAAEDEKKVQ